MSEELLLRWLGGDSADWEEGRVRLLLGPILEGGSAAALIEIDDVEWKMREASERERRSRTAEIISHIRTFVSEHRLGTFISAHHERCLVLASVPEDDFLAGLEELIPLVQRKTALP